MAEQISNHSITYASGYIVISGQRLISWLNRLQKSYPCIAEEKDFNNSEIKAKKILSKILFLMYHVVILGSGNNNK